MKKRLLAEIKGLDESAKEIQFISLKDLPVQDFYLFTYEDLLTIFQNDLGKLKIDSSFCKAEPKVQKQMIDTLFSQFIEKFELLRKAKVEALNSHA